MQEGAMYDKAKQHKQSADDGGQNPQQDNLGFVPFHQQQDLKRPPDAAPASIHPEPSLSLSLDSQAGPPTLLQQGDHQPQEQHGHLNELTDSRPFDLENPISHEEHPISVTQTLDTIHAADIANHRQTLENTSATRNSFNSHSHSLEATHAPIDSDTHHPDQTMEAYVAINTHADQTIKAYVAIGNHHKQTTEATHAASNAQHGHSQVANNIHHGHIQGLVAGNAQQHGHSQAANIVHHGHLQGLVASNAHNGHSPTLKETHTASNINHNQSFEAPHATINTHLSHTLEATHAASNTHYNWALEATHAASNAHHSLTLKASHAAGNTNHNHRQTLYAMHAICNTDHSHVQNLEATHWASDSNHSHAQTFKTIQGACNTNQRDVQEAEAASNTYHSQMVEASLTRPMEFGHGDIQRLSPHSAAPPEQAESLHLQLVPASELQKNEQQYPPAFAAHEAVIQDKELFMATLDNFLAALGMRLMTPKLGGEDMDLHAMYCEVTARGGIEQVIRCAQWKELIEAMDISIPLPNASFVLRKHYTNVLFHYEQVYYCRSEGKIRSPPVPLPAPSPTVPMDDFGLPYEAPPEIESALKKRKRKLDPMEVFGVDPAASIGTLATGAINGKFDEGYLVTVVVGAQKLMGVLYHVSADNNVQQFASVPSLLNGVGSDWDAPGLEVQLYKKRKERFSKKRDQNAPRRTRTGYNIYLKEQRAILMRLYPESKGLGKKVTEMWSKLPENEKALYIERGLHEREKFKKESLEYQETMGLQSQVCDGTGGPVDAHGNGAYDVSHDYHVSLDVEGDMSSLQGAEAHGYPSNENGATYHVDGSDMHPPRPETSGGDCLDPVQAYEMREDEGQYAEEPGSEDAVDSDLEGEEDDVYSGSEQAYEGPDDDRVKYHVSDETNKMQESIYPSHVDRGVAPDSEAHDGSAAPELRYYGQGHASAYPSSLPQQQMHTSQVLGSMASTVQVSYQAQDNEILHPYLQRGFQEVSGDAMSQQQYFAHDRYPHAHARQGQVREAFGASVSSDQAAYMSLDQGHPYATHLQHQSQAVRSNAHTRPMFSEQETYQNMFPYYIHAPYGQIYLRPRPHAYPAHSPQYPSHMLNDAQAIQYGRALASQLHCAQRSIPEVSGTLAPQVHHVQDGHIYYVQGHTLPAYKHCEHG